MNKEDLKRKILETKQDIFPLDKLLPLETVYFMWKEEYVKTNDRNLFFRDRKFQRLREGYFSLFAAISLNQTTKHKHLLLFPSVQDNDVYLVYPNKNNLVGYAFDVKEFTNWSDSFAEFVNRSIIPKIHIYNLIIATYRKIDRYDLDYLITVLEEKNIDKRVWVVSAPTEDHDNNDISKVTIVDKSGLVYDQILDVGDWVDKKAPTIVYQDHVRLVAPLPKS